MAVLDRPVPVTPEPLVAAVRRRRRPRWPVLIVAAAGLAMVAAAYALSRSGNGEPGPRLLFWMGYATVVLPIAGALLSPSTTRGERMTLVVALGLLGYAIKVLHDPWLFTLSDEFTHLSATQVLTGTERLFEPVPFVGGNVAAGYPGLHSVTAALSGVTGMSLFASGVLVIGAARVILMLALFGLAERLTGSARTAGIAVLAYGAGANFLFWSAQFSYQSLSLPLMFAALLAIAARPRSAWAAALLVVAVAATHHLTSYLLAALLWVLATLWPERRRALAALAVLATAVAAVWLTVVSSATGDYLGFIFERTAQAFGDGARRPFASAGLPTPWPERLLGLTAAGLICLATLAALRGLPRERRLPRRAAAALGLAALAFLAQYPMKLLPSAWETANRAADFLFPAVTVLIALLLVRKWGTWGRRGRIATVALVSLVVCGGVAQGPPGPLLLSQPVRIDAQGATLLPEGFAAAAWATDNLPAGSTYVADEATGRELSVAGAHRVHAGRAAGVPQLLQDPALEPWERAFLAEKGIDFVVADRRRISADNLAGYFAQRADAPDGGLGYYAPGVRRGFEALPGVSRVMDSGEIVIYDVRALHGTVRPCTEVSGPLTDQAVTCRTSSSVLVFGDPRGRVGLPGEVVTVLSTRTEASTQGLVVDVYVQVENTSESALRPDPDWRQLYLSVGGRRVDRRRMTTERRDNLDGTRRIPAGGKAAGNLRFVLGPREAAAFRARGADLGIARPADEQPPLVGVVRLDP